MMPGMSPATSQRMERSWLGRLPGRMGRVAAALCIAVMAGVALLGLYALVMWLRLPGVQGLGTAGDPGHTAFMAEARCATIERVYRPLEELDPRLACAVIWSEDWQFFHHQGVDWDALEMAWDRNLEAGDVRLGASTLPMQLARNLYLSRSRTPSRKFREMILARRLVASYERTRLIELYLNAAEWAPCVYGAEAAARHYFGHGASVLDLGEATFLAVMLPRPSRPPGQDRDDRRALVRRQHRLLGRLARAGLIAPATDRKARAHVIDLDLWRGSRGHGDHSPGVRDPAPRAWLVGGCGTRPPPP